MVKILNMGCDGIQGSILLIGGRHFLECKNRLCQVMGTVLYMIILCMCLFFMCVLVRVLGKRDHIRGERRRTAIVGTYSC